MERKYVLTDETIEYLGHTLHRIQAVKDFGIISAGTLGGYIESETNLDHTGEAWVALNAKVYENAMVCDNARIGDNARVYGNSKVYDNALVCGTAFVHGHAMVYGDACISDANICSVAKIYGNVRVFGNITISGNARLSDNTDYATVRGFGRYSRDTTFFRCSDGLVRCQCGCFYGTVDEFRSKVRETHGNSKYAKEYLMIADLMELHFNKGE